MLALLCNAVGSARGAARNPVHIYSSLCDTNSHAKYTSGPHTHRTHTTTPSQSQGVQDIQHTEPGWGCSLATMCLCKPNTSETPEAKWKCVLIWGMSIVRPTSSHLEGKGVKLPDGLLSPATALPWADSAPGRAHKVGHF